MPLTRRELLGGAATGPFIRTARAAAARRPNFLFLLTDDQSYATLSITGGQFFATNDLAAIGRHGIGIMTVSNAIVVLTNTSVGRHLASAGTLNVAANAELSLIADLSLGRLTGSSGQVFVHGGLQ